MSLEAALGGRSVSPVSSGRSTPVPRTSRRAEEDGAHKGDKTFRKYSAIIERALGSWEISPEEWADYIAFLGRLLKAIQSHPRDIAILPHSSSVASKLSQCMNPALPSGVHQKALEVYSFIFSTFGRHFVADHLDELFPGLSAVLSFASLSVRPAIYEILEEHIIPLSSADLRPLLKALVLSLLPALEEETSEDFDRAFRSLETLEKKFAQAGEGSAGGEKTGFFWQCLFLAVITSPPRRQGALNFLATRLPRFETTAHQSKDYNEHDVNGASKALSPDAEAVVSPEPGLLVRAFVCGLSDPQLLIQRGFLDLIVTHLPLSSPLLQTRIRKDDLDRLVTAAMHVLLRREMSLNRRLWSWFLGPEPKNQASESQPTSPIVRKEEPHSKRSTTQLEYFSTYGRPALQRSIVAMFKRDYPHATERARPFRLCLSMMDRWEIGGSIVPDMFLPAIESAYEYSLKASPTDTAELVRSASLFFDSIEASLIWSNILDLVDSAFKENSDSIKSLDLCRWIIQRFNIKDEEMITTHIPRCILFLLAQIRILGDLRSARAAYTLEIATILFETVPARAFPQAATSTSPDSKPVRSQSDFEALCDAIHRAYRSQDPPEAESTMTSPEKLTLALHHTILSLTLQTLDQGKEAHFSQAVSLLSSLQGKSPSLEVLRSTRFLETATTLLKQQAGDSKTLGFPTIASMIALVSTLRASQTTAALVSETATAQLESILTPQIWLYLSPSNAKYHVEATRVLWHLHELSGSGCHLEATLTGLIGPSRAKIAHGDHGSAEAARRFGVLWSHSISGPNAKMKQGPPGSLRRASTMPSVDFKQSIARQDVLAEPLMLILDMLSEPQTPSHAVVKSWLHSLPTLEQVFRIHFDLLDGLVHPNHQADGPDSFTSERNQSAATRTIEYIMDHFLAILKHRNEWVSECLGTMYLQSERPGNAVTGLVCLVEHCSRFVCGDDFASKKLEQTAMDIIELALSGPDATSLKSLELDSLLIDRLLSLLDETDVGSQSSLLELIKSTITLRLAVDNDDADSDRPRSRNSVSKRPSTAGFKPSPSAPNTLLASTAPPKLLLLLRTGFSSNTARSHIEKWLRFLSHVLPIFSDAIFSGLIPLVECLCKELDKAHAELISASQVGTAPQANSPESTIIALLEAMEMVLARAHRCLEEEEQSEPEQRPTTQTRGLLGNVTSGVFRSEAPPSRSSHANSRLTVILTFQDAIRVSLRLWIWGSHSSDMVDFDKSSAATTSYNALRVRNRTRHLLEQIFAVEPLESLEVVMSNWCFEEKAERAAASLNLLHVLQGTRPKNVIPAILDALCSRTNPSALPSDRLSTQSTDLTALDVAVFLSAYLQSTEDDAMDEVWPDCMAFLRDVLGNPLPYRQVLPTLLLTVLLLAQKLENTNFGEQRKMRKELGDSFNRLLTAVFTTMPSGYTQDPSSSDEHLSRSDRPTSASTRTSTSLIAALREVTSSIEVILETVDRANSAMNSISSNLIGPMFKAKSFPKNVTPDTLGLLLQITNKAPTTKVWKKELLDAFNDPRLLTSKPDLMEKHWFPVLYQWSVHDKERMPELLTRLTPPSSAGIMFGVGANAARLEADRRTQLNLRRISLLTLACPEDSFAIHLRTFNEKLAELFDATASSSPSAAVKAELFMLCRAIVLSTSPIQLAPMWPIINDNLHAALASILPNATNGSAYANLALLQACKLLDLLITLSPDEFQLHEWLYVTDTIDAVYQPADFDPAALSDQIAVAMASEGVEDGSSLVQPTPIVNAQPGQRRPLLDSNSMSSQDDFKAMAREDFTHTILRPFLSQLSMYAYEAVYGMDTADTNACRRNLLDDLLDLSTIVE